MLSKNSYELHCDGGWKLLVLREKWNSDLWKVVQTNLGESSPSRHPQVKSFTYLREHAGKKFFLKIYHPKSLAGTLKDLFRRSRAFRALEQGCSLAREGFHAPVAVAAGEERFFRVLRRAFLLTVGVDGFLLPEFLLRRYLPPLTGTLLKEKREFLEQLAIDIRRLHKRGFVHGDLVPYNIFVQPKGNGVTFYYMDNDRTRRYPFWLSRFLWKRNMVQLNRFVLTGISLQDRMRFLRFYLGEKPVSKKGTRLIHWLENKTRKRRRECDQVHATVSFRELMRWDGPFAHHGR